MRFEVLVKNIKAELSLKIGSIQAKQKDLIEAQNELELIKAELEIAEEALEKYRGQVKQPDRN